MIDLLLRGGMVVDPSQGLRGEFDVAVQDGRIVRVAAPEPEPQALRVIDVTGMTVTPGLIDQGDWVVYDTIGESMRISQCVVPVLTVKRG